jgi:CBS domain-containing protein
MIAKDLMKTNYSSIDVNSTVSQLLSKMKRDKIHYVLVFNGKKYMGVVSRRFLLSSRIDPKKMKVTNIVKRRSKSKIPFFVPTLKEDTSLKQISKLMATSDSHVLPVIEGSKVLGVVYARDVVQAIASEYRSVSCDALASMKLITAKESDDVSSIMQKMNWHHIDHLPVVDNNDKLTGMVCMADLVEKPEFWQVSNLKIPKSASHLGNKKSGHDMGERNSMTGLPISNCMSRKKLCSTQPSMSIAEAVKMMKKSGVCSIVLVRYNEPVGIMTLKDILKDYAK